MDNQKQGNQGNQQDDIKKQQGQPDDMKKQQQSGQHGQQQADRRIRSRTATSSTRTSSASRPSAAAFPAQSRHGFGTPPLAAS